MIDFVDVQYAQALAGRMERFKVTRTNPTELTSVVPYVVTAKSPVQKQGVGSLRKITTSTTIVTIVVQVIPFPTFSG